MPSILNLRKTLTIPPEKVPSGQDTFLRGYQHGDAAGWLRLKSAALPTVQAGREWTEQDFSREFLSQPWWLPARMILATNAAGRIIGTATMGRRGMEGRWEPTVHWLMVDPEYQRRGVATALVFQLERMCWQSGGRSISLETLSSWEAAVAFYLARGYAVTE